ncbi:aminotransferase class I/II-fold pyridoxal phosphate-dependent enzyme [Nocardia sp. ET3-3]|uniref:Aminotransferase class I/II-fold pyridoxal phosphate-dependent enzyme n=1 Tax=Nocardia terrae TaxID=2675851 RepID=A0A7K1UW43_9NOCA|nr:DegT/DnrJ/EryC1/StrS family aminotransferase [Nocardia terrae]MVU78555.1 aminotransferase class I/II-fold pyridoxal phosphate-dependent enzyme [Nocardia terrae]
MLAIHGGTPVRGPRPWPVWPQYDARTETELLAALRSSRWSVSWYSPRGEKSRERLFAEAFARYHDAAYGVSVDHGSGALVIALEALGIGPGDEVIVPAMTWVAPATAVLRVGALPVLVDVDPDTGCLTAEHLRAAVSTRTKAVIVVHLACTTADLDALVAATRSAGLALIEDCSQSHGARWAGRTVGTFGDIGVFSLGAAKSLAAGEAGAAITDDPDLYQRMLMLRADSRGYTPEAPGVGEYELVEHGTVMGANYCMSELTAAVLLEQLTRLDDQHTLRETRAKELEAALPDIPGLAPIPVPAPVDRRAIYEYGIRFTPGTFGTATVDQVAAALTAELGTRIYPPRVPLHRSVLLRPHTKPRFAHWWTQAADRAAGRPFTGADHYREHTLLMHHSVLLGDRADVEDILTALDKVRTHAATLETKGKP